jgi:hypothetical protein
MQMSTASVELVIALFCLLIRHFAIQEYKDSLTIDIPEETDEGGRTWS